MKTTENDTTGKIYHVLGLQQLIMSKWLYYPRQSVDSMQSLTKIPMAFFTELEQVAKTILRKKNGARGYSLASDYTKSYSY